MNFHIFVIIATIIFYIILRFYKSSVLYQRRTKQSSNFIYVLFLPAILYLANFMYKCTDAEVTENIKQIASGNPGNPINHINPGNVGMTDIVSESLLSAPFPESSISVSS